MGQWRNGSFVNDSWHATRNITLNLGLRYELNTPAQTYRGYASELNEEFTEIIPTNLPSLRGLGSKVTDITLMKNFALAGRTQLQVRAEVCSVAEIAYSAGFSSQADCEMFRRTVPHVAQGISRRRTRHRAVRRDSAWRFH